MTTFPPPIATPPPITLPPPPTTLPPPPITLPLPITISSAFCIFGSPMVSDNEMKTNKNMVENRTS
ncbi:hypothetical protein ZOSMA_153G00170 [Zostera marina]|uniref:Uncharacterized protein n=1 Tax=Zostera marina TaxID=29655 RepID=A0A0K9PY41_ZOSMR|nr:hypothetical protein ZOSMA_153G00170 [Zostera marina]